MRRNLFLYLALVCFLGLVAIFIVDGYIGIYDTIFVGAGEREQTIEPDFWLRENGFWSVGAGREEKVTFRYQVNNRRFSSYAADIEVSVWRTREKLKDVTLQAIVVAPFDEEEVTWEIENTEVLPAGLAPEQSYEYTVIIKRGGMERKVIVNINPFTYPTEYPYPVKPVPAVPPR